MKNLFVYIIFFSCFSLAAVERIPGGWTESGELAYNYAYARGRIGYEMRKDGWVCKLGFTAGRFREQEHSVWVKGKRKMQVMIWRIDSGRTGYSKGEIKEGNTQRK